MILLKTRSRVLPAIATINDAINSGQTGPLIAVLFLSSQFALDLSRLRRLTPCLTWWPLNPARCIRAWDCSKTGPAWQEINGKGYVILECRCKKRTSRVLWPLISARRRTRMNFCFLRFCWIFSIFSKKNYGLCRISRFEMWSFEMLLILMQYLSGHSWCVVGWFGKKTACFIVDI